MGRTDGTAAKGRDRSPTLEEELSRFDDCTSSAEIDALYQELFRNYAPEDPWGDKQWADDWNRLSMAMQRAHGRYTSETLARVAAREAAQHTRQQLEEWRKKYSAADVRAWALAHSIEVNEKGRIKPSVYAEYAASVEADTEDAA